VIGVQQEPERLSQILNATATTNLVCNLIFAKFVKYDEELNLVPDLIEAIPTRENGGVSSDHLTYTYTLRRDALWHDGTPVTSADVKFTYGVIMHPDVVVESREGWDVVESVETPDPHTVVFHLGKPYPGFVSETFMDESVLPEHLLGGVMEAKFHLSDFHRAPIGCGPFVFKEWISGSHIVVTRNDAYYGEGPYLDEIIFKFIPDENALLVQLKTGEIDVYDNASLTFLDQARKLPGVELYSTPTMMYEHLDLNAENPILQDRRVRKALGYGTNRAEITKHVYRGWAREAVLDEHPSSKFYNPSAAASVRYDPLEARRLLRDAGWTDADGNGVLEKDGNELVLTISATAGNPDREKTELVLQKQYRDIGIDLRIENHNATVLYGSFEDGGVLKRGKFDIAMYAWLSSPEPATKSALYAADNIPPNGQNHPRIRHAQLTELLDRGSSEVDEDIRRKLYHQISDILVEEMPVIPLFWYTTVDLCSARLHNYKPNPTQSADTWNANTWYLAD
jgi:peptide/nickel transport system substrate-binding protein